MLTVQCGSYRIHDAFGMKSPIESMTALREEEAIQVGEHRLVWTT